MVAKNAGMPATPADLINVDEVIGKYYDVVPDPNVPEQRVSFGTSGHRGSSLKTSFNEAHIVACVMATMWASLNEVFRDEPRCPEVPKETRCSGTFGSGTTS